MQKKPRMNNNDFLLQIEGLTKKFGNYAAVDQVDLEVRRGEIYGFLGPNGAGKTTTIKMLAGLLLPDQGKIYIGGHDLSQKTLQCKAMTGYIPDRPFLYEKLTGMEFLHFIASLYRLPEQQLIDQSARLLNLFDLSDWQDHLIESYSHGMRQKLIMTAAFMLNLPLIIVDEPMVGLDPKSARIVKELFKQHAAVGGSVFLSTHSLEVAEELCDRISIILNGKIRVTGNMDELQNAAKMKGSGLEEIFLELTGAYELQSVIHALKGNS